MSNCTILVRKGTREKLKDLGKKAQTYDDLINELIERRQRSHDRRRTILEARQISFASEDNHTQHRGDGNKKTLVGQRFDPLAQQVSGDHKD